MFWPRVCSCIGRHNYRPFFLLVSLGALNLYLGAWLAFHLTTLYSLYPSLGQLNPSFPQIGIDAAQFGVQNTSILLGVLGAFYLVAAALVTYLLGFHVRLYFSGGLTTFEWLVSDRDRKMALDAKRRYQPGRIIRAASTSSTIRGPWTCRSRASVARVAAATPTL
ncbi:hypothetical protein BCR44DRAFT_1099684 [Catenaria anguillulae PL171]|uniref:Palmitoyltransferase n=1 Tax=Catenaria anguillulae PL171 TaxID=765915 RepID=A0A1Y2I479_9FUNG|nr:hypothetical protein BCR44DRAFT_1099684 [Catenaria anguillulae PL171]